MSILTRRTELLTVSDLDWIHIVDVSDTTDSPQGTSKKIRKSNLITAIGGGAWGEITGTLSDQTDLQSALDGKENTFSKNTGFNKNLGTTAGTVSEGNHTHTFSSLTSKPTTIAGYGITDFNSLGDARWLGTAGTAANSALFNGLSSSQFLRRDIADTKTSGNLSFADGVRLEFGTGSDVSGIYSSGGNTIFSLYTNDLEIRDNSTNRFTFGRTTGDFSLGGHIQLNDYRSLKLGTGSQNVNIYSSGSNIEVDLVDVDFRIRNSGVGTLVTFGRTTGSITATGSGIFGDTVTSTKDNASTTLGSNPVLVARNTSGGSYGTKAELHFLNGAATTSASSALISSEYKSYGSAKYGGELVFATLKATTDSAPVERFRLNEVGGTFVGTVTATAFYESSDRTLKTNIQPISDTFRTFERKDELGKLRYGVIAQEVETTNPELVNTDADGLKSVNYTDLLVMKVAEQENRLQEQGEKIERLEALVEQLLKG